MAQKHKLWTEGNPLAKYVQKIKPAHVKSLRKRGYSVRLLSNHEHDGVPFGVYGYYLLGPDQELISPEPRKWASQAWDDILL